MELNAAWALRRERTRLRLKLGQILRRAVRILQMARICLQHMHERLVETHTAGQHHGGPAQLASAEIPQETAVSTHDHTTSKVRRDTARSAEHRERMRLKGLRLKLGQILRRAVRILQMGRICLQHMRERLALVETTTAGAAEDPTRAASGPPASSNLHAMPLSSCLPGCCRNATNPSDFALTAASPGVVELTPGDCDHKPLYCRGFAPAAAAPGVASENETTPVTDTDANSTHDVELAERMDKVRRQARYKPRSRLTAKLSRLQIDLQSHLSSPLPPLANAHQRRARAGAIARVQNEIARAERQAVGQHHVLRAAAYQDQGGLGAEIFFSGLGLLSYW